MDSLSDKLKRRNKKRKPQGSTLPQSPLPKDEPKSHLVGQLREKLDQITSKRPAVGNLKRRRRDDDLPGEVIDTEAGSILTIEKHFGLSYRHGRYLAADFLKTGKHLGTLAQDDRLSIFDPKGALFVDTETTGLAGGTGTLPFLIGIGRFQAERFVVKQVFCREPSEEKSQLTFLSTYLSDATSLVSFNGKAFDVPLINTRFVLNQMKNPGAHLPHLDLLHIARRVFKRRLKNCSLGNLESAVLGFERVGDIAGSDIPGAYRNYLRGGPVGIMESVLSHNALDLVGLAALGAVLENMYCNPNLVEHAADHLGLAKTALLGGDHETANAHLFEAGNSASTLDSKDAHVMAAKAAARKGAFLSAVEHYEQALAQTPQDSAVHLALAKLYEHKFKDFDSALTHAAHTKAAEGTNQSIHRIARLNRRKSKT